VKDLIVFLAKALVDKPDVVELTVTPAADHALYELKVAPDDIGKVMWRTLRGAPVGQSIHSNPVQVWRYLPPCPVL